MIFWLLVLTGVVVDVQLQGGGPLRGTLESLSGDGLTMKVGAQTRSLGRDRILAVRIPEPVVPEASEQALVEFADGSSVAASALLMKDGMLEARRGKYPWKASASSVRAVRLLPIADTERKQWETIAASIKQEDLLILRRGENLDYLPGIVSGIDQGGIQFDYKGRTVPVPFERAAGVVLARVKKELPAARMRIEAVDGSQFLVKTAKADQQQLALSTVAGVDFRMPLTSLKELTYPELAATFLADLAPEKVKYEPFFGSQSVGGVLASLFAPQRNRSFDGTALRVVDKTSPAGVRQFQSGLAIHSRTEMTFRLAGRYERFRASAGMDPVASSLGHVELVVRGDDKELARHVVKAGDAPLDLEVDVRKVLRLHLLVDFGEHQDVGDRLHLGDARLTK